MPLIVWVGNDRRVAGVGGAEAHRGPPHPRHRDTGLAGQV